MFVLFDQEKLCLPSRNQILDVTETIKWMRFLVLEIRYVACPASPLIQLIKITPQL